MAKNAKNGAFDRVLLPRSFVPGARREAISGMAALAGLGTWRWSSRRRAA